MPRVLLTSVCRPLGPKHGDAPSVGYELLFAQVTRAQGLFSPRATHLHFGLEYIAENLETPTMVLQYPSKKQLIAELKKGYDYIGISFLLAVFHRVKEVVALVRRYSPSTKIVLGGYGTVMDDEMLKPYADHICREEGVAFFRRLLGEPPLAMPYRHPLIVSRLKLFSMPVSRTGMIFAGLGCPNGCDFCCTSHFFQRKHIKLLPTGKDIYGVIERYLALDPAMSFTILDEDFLLNKRRADEFKACVQEAGRPLSIFCFASIRALAQYTPQDLHEMGVDGLWIGYEGTRSGFAKQGGRAAAEVFNELKANGITILTSMIVGFDYQDKVIVSEELEGLLALDPCLSQFLIYGPTPGTPFWERIKRAGRLRDDLVADKELYAHSCDGFTAMVKHPKLSAGEIEGLQRWCFDQDFKRLGPSIYRVIERWLLGYRKFKDSPSPFLRAKAARFANDVRNAYPSFLVGRLLGPSSQARRRVAGIETAAYAELGAPSWKERLASFAAVGAGLWTGLCLKLDWFQHPHIRPTPYRIPKKGWADFRLWEALPEHFRAPGMALNVDVQHAERLVCLRVEGSLKARQARELFDHVKTILAGHRDRLILDLHRLRSEENGALRSLADKLAEHRKQIRLVLPKLQYAHPELLLLARMFHQYKDNLF
ncbi:MAG: hypothetical protein NTX64_08400 [Elusimicrobia bacterium]|nr:hypothetical protein [Elusimicrobiota bacterium]